MKIDSKLLSEMIEDEIGSKEKIVETVASEAYEQEVIDAIASANASGNITSGAGSGGGADADIKINGKIYKVEVKMSTYDQLGGGSLHYYPSKWNRNRLGRDERIQFAYKKNADDKFDADTEDLIKNALWNYSSRLSALVNLIGFFRTEAQRPKWIRWARKVPLNLDRRPFGHWPAPTRIPSGKIPKLVWDEAVKKGYVAAANFNIEADTSFVEQHYNAKGVYYIQIGGAGLFYMGKNPAKLPVPKLDGAIKIEARPGAAGSGGKQYRTFGFRIQGRFVNKKAYSSSYTLDDAQSIRALIRAIKPKKRKRGINEKI